LGFYILPDFQNKGIGKKLFTEMANYFKENKCKKLIIWTLKNAQNNKFYKKKGGIEKEFKELIFGNKKYNGVGFVYYLAFIPAKPDKRFERNL
jgi:GNAT superfamily N-acetyltransferase